MPRFSESTLLATVAEPKDYGSAGIRSTAIHMGKLHSVSLIVTFGALTGNSILIPYASAARALTTTALAFNYRLSSAVFSNAGNNSSDQLGDIVAVTASGLTLVAATFQHKQIVIEFDSDAFTDAKPWLTVNIDATATLMNVGITAVGKPRYPGHLIPTVF